MFADVVRKVIILIVDNVVKEGGVRLIVGLRKHVLVGGGVFIAVKGVAGWSARGGVCITSGCSVFVVFAGVISSSSGGLGSRSGGG